MFDFGENYCIIIFVSEVLTPQLDIGMFAVQVITKRKEKIVRKNAKLQTALWYSTTSIESTRTRFFNIYQIFVDAGVKFNW